jgi:hypothetical protein
MKYPVFILLVVMLVGCSTPRPRKVSTEEDRVLEVVRQAVTEREGRSWARDAEYYVHRDGDGCFVIAIRPTRHLFGRPTYQIGSDRSITLDKHYAITSYFAGF